MIDPTDDELLEAALSAVNQEPPEAQDQQGQGGPAPKPPLSQRGPLGPTLAGLDKRRRPQAATVCEGCPNSVWFASQVELRCYCRVMYLVTWSSKEPQQLTSCDGAYLV